ncbi:MAG: 50S ribosomal protein L22 [Chloroflexota bacterium]|nr:50S ribosomal protein L22 [Chloroflexota bacterium]
MRVRAVNKYVRSSPQKARLVADLVRGKPVDAALSILKFTPKGVALDIAKTVQSAAANAENNFEMDRQSLYIAEIYADDGPTLKRLRAAPKGRGVRILKRTSHITVIVDERNQED